MPATEVVIELAVTLDHAAEQLAAQVLQLDRAHRRHLEREVTHQHTTSVHPSPLHPDSE